MNKKGFTLIELLAVITLMAIIAVIAIPNVVRMVDNSKREDFVADAKNMISKAKYMYRFVDGKYSDKFENMEGCKTITLGNLDLDLGKNPDGDAYDLNRSKVRICLLSNEYAYAIILSSNETPSEFGRGIGDAVNGTFIAEEDITKSSVN